MILRNRPPRLCGSATTWSALAHRRGEARERRGVGEAQPAREIGDSRARINKIERGDIDRNEVDTLWAYVTALGGHLEIVADFGGDRMVLG